MDINNLVEQQPLQVPAAAIQVVDSVVSKEKFDEETNNFLTASAIHRKRGIIVLDCMFPDIKIAFCAPQMKPSPIVFAVNVNFSNYDLEPLSVKFIDPFTFSLVAFQQIAGLFGRKIGEKDGKSAFQPLLLELNKTPFICLPGVREYHNHPDHSNDPWLCHRGVGGEGTLGFVIEKLYQYGIPMLNGYQFPPIIFPRLLLSIDQNSIPE